MRELGSVQFCDVIGEENQGFVLERGKHQIFLPYVDAEEDTEIGEEAEVFLYQNKEGSYLATSYLPQVTVSSYGWATAADIIPKLGVFVHIGLKKDMLVSKDNLPVMQEVWPKRGDKLFVKLHQDPRGRLFAVPADEEVIMGSSEEAPADIQNQTVKGHVYRASKVGSFLWTEERYRAFLHHSESERELRLGEKAECRVIGLREDGTINVSLRPMKVEGMDRDAEAILIYLTRNGGEMPFTDKSGPDDIYDAFGISKAAFKRAVGRLLKKQLIIQTPGESIRFNTEKENSAE